MRRFIFVLAIALFASLPLFAAAEDPPEKKSSKEKAATTVKSTATSKTSPYMKAVRDTSKSSKSTFVLTNKSLKGWQDYDQLTVTPGTSDEKLPELSEYKDSKNKGESYWRNRVKTLTSQVKTIEQRVTRLQSQVNQYKNDFYRWDDANYRDSVIKPAWDSAVMDLEQAKKNLETTRKELAKLPDEARKAGALPGWLR